MTTFPSAPPNSRTGSSGWEDVFVDVGSVHEHGTRNALANPANVVLDPTHSGCLEGSVALRAHLADWDCSSHFLARDTAETQDRASSTRVFVGMAWRRSVEQLPMHIVHPWFFFFTGLLLWCLRWSCWWSLVVWCRDAVRKAHNGMVKKVISWSLLHGIYRCRESPTVWCVHAQTQ